MSAPSVEVGHILILGLVIIIGDHPPAETEQSKVGRSHSPLESVRHQPISARRSPNLNFLCLHLSITPQLLPIPKWVRIPAMG